MVPRSEIACHAGTPTATTASRDRLYRVHTHEVFDGILEPGRHRIALATKAVKAASLVVAGTSGSVLVEAVAC